MKSIKISTNEIHSFSDVSGVNNVSRIFKILSLFSIALQLIHVNGNRTNGGITVFSRFSNKIFVWNRIEQK